MSSIRVLSIHNTHSNITPLSLPLKDPSTRSPYVAFGLSSLFPQTGGATSTQINDLFCLPTSLRRHMVEFWRTGIEGLKMGKFSRTIKKKKNDRMVENTAI